MFVTHICDTTYWFVKNFLQPLNSEINFVFLLSVCWWDNNFSSWYIRVVDPGSIVKFNVIFLYLS